MVRGRETLAPHLPLYGRGTWIVRAALLHPLVVRFLGAWKLWVASGLLAAVVRKAAAARVKAKASPLVAQPSGKQLSAPQTPIGKPKKASFFSLLAPENDSIFPISGAPEIGLLVLASLANAWLMLYKAWLMREFVTGQNLGLWQSWLKALAKFPLATFASAFLVQVTAYMQNRVALLWRRVATRRLLRDYFSGMNYYKLLQHGTLRIDDPDVRICSDVQAACDALTLVFMNGMSGVMMSLFSS